MNCEDLISNPGWAGVVGPAAADGPAREGKLDFDSVVTVVVDVNVAEDSAAFGADHHSYLRCHHADYTSLERGQSART